jgi:hypothetical protein
MVIMAYNMVATTSSLSKSLQTFVIQVSSEWFSPRHLGLVKALVQFEKKTLGSVSFATPEDLFTSKFVNSKIRAKASAGKRIVRPNSMILTI